MQANTKTPSSPAQQAAQEIVSRTQKQWDVRTPAKPLPVVDVDIDAIHRRRDNVIAASQPVMMQAQKLR